MRYLKLKKYLLMGMAACLLHQSTSLQTTVYAQTKSITNNTQYYQTTISLNFRNEAGGKVIGSIPKNAQVLKVGVSKKNSKWFQVKYGNRIGFVHSAYLKKVSNSTNNNKAYYKVTSTVSIRKDKNGSIIGRLNKNTIVQKLGVHPKDSRWLLVQANGIKGYVYNQYLIPSSTPTSNIPSKTPTNPSRSDKNEQYVKVTIELNIRQDASGKIIGKLPKNSTAVKLSVHPTNPSWIKVKQGNLEGYVLSTYTTPYNSKNTPSSTSPVEEESNEVVDSVVNNLTFNANTAELSIPKAYIKNKNSISYNMDLLNSKLIIKIPKANIPTTNFNGSSKTVVSKISIKNDTITVYGNKVVEYIAQTTKNGDLILKLVEPRKKYKKIVILDAGHGGHDPGAVSTVNGVQEKELNLDLTLKTKTFIERESNIKVYLIRSTDVFYELGQRAKIANNVYGDLFVSIHNNVSINGKAQGSETFYYNNAVSGKISSSKAAQLIQKHMVSAMKNNNRGVKNTGYYVVKYTKIPAVLVEGEFLDHPIEGKKLATQERRQQLAKGIASGIIDVFASYSTQR